MTDMLSNLAIFVVFAAIGGAITDAIWRGLTRRSTGVTPAKQHNNPPAE